MPPAVWCSPPMCRLEFSVHPNVPPRVWCSSPMCRLEFGVHPQHATCSLVFTPNVSPFCLHLCCLGFTPNVLHDMSVCAEFGVFFICAEFGVFSICAKFGVFSICAKFGVHPQCAASLCRVWGSPPTCFVENACTGLM